MDKYQLKFSIYFGIIYILGYHIYALFNLISPFDEYPGYKFKEEYKLAKQTYLVHEFDSIESQSKTYFEFTNQYYDKKSNSNSVIINSTDKSFDAIRYTYIGYYIVGIIIYALTFIYLLKLVKQIDQSVLFTDKNYKLLKKFSRIIQFVSMFYFIGAMTVFFIIYFLSNIYISFKFDIEFITFLIAITLFNIFINITMQYFIKANKIEVDQSLTV